MSGDVDAFADEIEAGYRSCLHGLRRQVLCIDTADGNLGGSHALRPDRRDRPGVDLIGKAAQGFVRHVGQTAGAARPAGHRLSQPGRQKLRQHRLHVLARLAGPGFLQMFEQIDFRQKVDGDRVALVPVR